MLGQTHPLGFSLGSEYELESEKPSPWKTHGLFISPPTTHSHWPLSSASKPLGKMSPAIPITPASLVNEYQKGKIKKKLESDVKT